MLLTGDAPLDLFALAVRVLDGQGAKVVVDESVVKEALRQAGDSTSPYAARLRQALQSRVLTMDSRTGMPSSRPTVVPLAADGHADVRITLKVGREESQTYRGDKGGGTTVLKGSVIDVACKKGASTLWRRSCPPYFPNTFKGFRSPGRDIVWSALLGLAVKVPELEVPAPSEARTIPARPYWYDFPHKPTSEHYGEGAKFWLDASPIRTLTREGCWSGEEGERCRDALNVFLSSAGLARATTPGEAEVRIRLASITRQRMYHGPPNEMLPFNNHAGLFRAERRGVCVASFGRSSTELGEATPLEIGTAIADVDYCVFGTVMTEASFNGWLGYLKRVEDRGESDIYEPLTELTFASAGRFSARSGEVLALVERAARFTPTAERFAFNLASFYHFVRTPAAKASRDRLLGSPEVPDGLKRYLAQTDRPSPLAGPDLAAKFAELMQKTEACMAKPSGLAAARPHVLEACKLLKLTSRMDGKFYGMNDVIACRNLYARFFSPPHQ